jgi:hypothetical protein
VDEHRAAAIEISEDGNLIRCPCGWSCRVQSPADLLDEWNGHRAGMASRRVDAS